MEKKFVSESDSVLYKEAVLVKSQSNGVDKWYIEFAQSSDSSTLQRYRPTFDLNRVHSKRERKNLADLIIELVNERLADGHAAESLILEVKKIVRKGRLKIAVNPFPQRVKPVRVAADEILEIRKKDSPDSSIQTYIHINNLFKQYLEAKSLGDKRVVDFSKSDAIGFMDWLLMRGVGSSTHNGRLTEIKIVFNELLRRDYVLDNPFNAIAPKKVKKSSKKRRVFTDDEAALVGKVIYEKSIWLFRAILLENYCGIRPAELRRLKFKHFDFKLGIVELSDDVVYKSKPRFATIPKVVLHHFLTEDFLKQPIGHFVFGAKFIPNPLRAVSRNYCTNKHKEILDNLHKKGLLLHREGLEFYSWKNTGITNLANDEKIGLFRTQNQVGHHSPEETMRYYRQSKVDEAIRDYDKTIF
jgi:integrase/recombinase XerD